jgi:hypothetical protein
VQSNIIDQNVNAAESLNHFLEHDLHLILFADVGLERHCRSAALLDVVDNLPGNFFVRYIVYHYGCADCSQRLGNRHPYSAVGSGH